MRKIYNEVPIIYKKYLKQLLKNEIKGEVHCTFVQDTLLVDIYGANSIVFRYTRKNMFSEIVQGVPSKTIADIIVQRYKDYILNLYFM